MSNDRKPLLDLTEALKRPMGGGDRSQQDVRDRIGRLRGRLKRGDDAYAVMHGILDLLQDVLS